MTSAYARTDAGGGGEESQDNLTGGGEFFFSWREIARCFWATGAFLGGKSHDHRRFEKELSFKSLAKRLLDSTEVLKLRKTCNICKWKEKV